MGSNPVFFSTPKQDLVLPSSTVRSTLTSFPHRIRRTAKTFVLVVQCSLGLEKPILIGVQAPRSPFLFFVYLARLANLIVHLAVIIEKYAPSHCPRPSAFRPFHSFCSPSVIGMIPSSGKHLRPKPLGLGCFPVVSVHGASNGALGLTVSSTRTQPARSAFVSLGLDFTSPFILRPQVGPVNLVR